MQRIKKTTSSLFVSIVRLGVSVAMFTAIFVFALFGQRYYDWPKEQPKRTR